MWLPYLAFPLLGYKLLQLMMLPSLPWDSISQSPFQARSRLCNIIESSGDVTDAEHNAFMLC